MTNKKRDLVVFRASDAPLGVLCPESLRADGGIRIAAAEAEANLGSAVHKGIQEYVQTGELPDFQNLALQHGVTPEQMEDLEILTLAGRRVWNRFCKAFANPKCEIEIEYKTTPHPDLEMPDLRCRCHPDVISLDDWDAPKTCFLLDWKTGRLELEYWAQMMFECMISHRRWPTIERWQWSIVHLRQARAQSNRIGEKVYLTIEDVEAFEKFYLNQIALLYRETPYYAPGDHCRWCRRFLRCEAQQETALAVVKSLDPEQVEEHCAALTDAGCVDLYEKLKRLEKLVVLALEQIKNRAAAGALEGDRGTMEMRDEVHLQIDVRRAWNLMRESLSNEALAGCLKVSKTGLEKAVRASAARGQKKQAWDDFLDRLKEADAVTEKVIPKIKFSKKRLELE